MPKSKSTLDMSQSAIAGLLNLQEFLEDGLSYNGAVFAEAQMRKVDDLVWTLTETLRRIETDSPIPGGRQPTPAWVDADSRLRANLRLRQGGAA